MTKIKSDAIFNELSSFVQLFPLHKMNKHPSAYIHICWIFWSFWPQKFFLILFLSVSFPIMKLCKHSKLISVDYRKQQSSCFGCCIWDGRDHFWAYVQHKAHFTAGFKSQQRPLRKQGEWAQMWSTKYLTTMLRQQQQYVILLWFETEMLSVDRVWSCSFSRTGRRISISC